MNSILIQLKVFLLDRACPVLSNCSSELCSVNSERLLLPLHGLVLDRVAGLVPWISDVVDDLVVEASSQEVLSDSQIRTILQSSDVPLAPYKALVQRFSPQLLFSQFQIDSLKETDKRDKTSTFLL